MAHTCNPIASILTAKDPAPFKILRKNGISRYIVVCDHATNIIPWRLHSLGLSKSLLEKHIALDIGALGVAMKISALLDAPLVFSSFSRLAIDVNRPLDSKDLIPEISDGIAIPGNRNIRQQEREQRVKELFYPYHKAISFLLSERSASGKTPVLISVHSFTPHLGGFTRPWDIGICYGNSIRLATEIIILLEQETDFTIGDNQPYPVDRQSDYTIPVHGDDQHILNVLFEIRQDHLADYTAISNWGNLLSRVLQSLEYEGDN